MVSDAQKRARDKWDTKNMYVLTFKIKREEADAFKDKCDRLGVTRSAVLHEAIRRFMAEAEPADEQ